jgi:ankyrin repeat protein
MSDENLAQYLARSIEKGQAETALSLLAHGDMPEPPLWEGRSLLVMAIAKDMSAVAARMSNLPCDLNARGDGPHPVFALAERLAEELDYPYRRGPWLELAQQMLERGASPDGAGAGTELPVDAAISSGDAEFATLLAAYGADFDLANRQGEKPLGRAAGMASDAVFETILAGTRNPDDAGAAGSPGPVWRAALAGRRDRLLRLVQAGCALSPERGGTALGGAVASNDPAMVDFVFSLGARLADEPPTERHALRRAMGPDGARREIVDRLLAALRDVESPDAEGRTLLAAAIACKDDYVAEILLSRGADPLAKCGAGATPYGRLKRAVGTDGWPGDARLLASMKQIISARRRTVLSRLMPKFFRKDDVGPKP